MNSAGHTLEYQPSMRPAPPTGPAPAYARTIHRVFPYSLRPVLLFTCIVSIIYLVLLGVSDFKTASSSEVTGKLKTLNIVEGVLFMAGAAVEVFGFFAVYTQRIPLARLYSYASLIAYLAVIASEVLGVVVTFTLKQDVINSCSTHYTGSRAGQGSIWGYDNDSGDGPMSAADAARYCESLWSSSRTWGIVWLFVTLLVGAMFVMFSFAYVRQLLDPSSVKVRISRFQQQHHPNHAGMQAPYDPDAAFSYPPPSANMPYSYPPPPGPPPLAGAPPPMYSGRASMDDDYDGDAKTPAAYGYGYNYGPGERQERPNRPGSSRGAEGEQDKRDSGETLRGEDSVKKVQSRHDDDDDDDDDAPRI